jgi:hypothetical protein
MESRVAVPEQIARNTSATLERLERRFEAIDRRIGSIDRRIDILTSEHRAELGVMLGGFGAMLGVMALGLHRL